MILSALALILALQTFTLEEARAMPPETLADALLDKGHPPIAKVIVHPTGMDAPSRSLHQVTLIGLPGVAPDKPGWCRRTDFTINLVPLAAGTNGYTTATPTRVDRVEARQSYRIATGNCAARDESFFLIRDETREAQFALMDRLIAARKLARGTRGLPFVLRCTDQDGTKYKNFGGDRCLKNAGRALLANLPLARTYNLSPASIGTIYRQGREARIVQRDAAIGMSDEALAIDVTIAEESGRITAITIVRHIPYPF